MIRRQDAKDRGLMTWRGTLTGDSGRELGGDGGGDGGGSDGGGPDGGAGAGAEDARDGGDEGQTAPSIG